MSFLKRLLFLSVAFLVVWIEAPGKAYIGRGAIPLKVGNLQAWYDLSDLSSLRNNAGAVPSNGDGIKLISDKSGNSSVNVLALNGVAGNNATVSSSSALNASTQLELVTKVMLTSLAVQQTFIGKTDNGIQNRYSFTVLDTGVLRLAISTTGTVGSFVLVSSSATLGSVGIVALQPFWVKVTWRASDGRTQFFYAANSTVEPSSWSQLGTDVTLSAASIFAGTSDLRIGGYTQSSEVPTGLIYRAIMWSIIGGANQLDANFATAAKLASTFTESSANAATVTINSSGDLGARICGARDLYQGTVANQPILTVSASGNFLTFDGVNDYMKAAAFALVQPETVYFVGSLVATSGTAPTFFDAGDSSTETSLGVASNTTNKSAYAGTALIGGTSPPATKQINTVVFNNLSGVSRTNRLEATTGTIGSNNSNGFTLGARSSISRWSNITTSEILIYSAAHDTTTQNAVINYLARKWVIPGGYAALAAPLPDAPIPQIEPDNMLAGPWRREEQLQEAA